MSYTKTYADTGSKLTINYPEGMFTVIENPREYWKEIDTEEYWGSEGEDAVRSQYPDVVLVPTNGSRISNGMIYVKKNYKEYEIDETGEQLSAEDNWSSDSPSALQLTNNYQFWNENITHVKDDCETMQCYRIYESLETNEWWFRRDKKLFEEGHSLRYSKKVWDIEITIEGETNFFKSNAQRYFCIGDAESQRAYFISRFNKKKMVGIVQVKEEQVVIDDDGERTTVEKTIDLYASSLLKRYTRQSPGKEEVEYSKVDTYQCLPDGTTRSNGNDEFLQQEQCVCDGFDCSMSFPRTNGYEYDLKGKNIVFRTTYLVSISNPGTRRKCMFVRDENEKVMVDLKNVATYNSYLLPKSGMNRIDYDGTTYYATKSGADAILMDGNCPDYFDDTYHIFTKYFATNATVGENSQVSKYIVGPGTDMPIKEYGVNLYPIFTNPICTHLVLITDHDHNGACQPDITRIKKVSKVLKNTFKEGYKEIKVTSWHGTSVAKQIKKLKESPSKLKILSIIGHGGQYSRKDLYPNKVGMSYSVFSGTSGLLKSRKDELVIDYEMLEYLMKDRGQDEYFYIFSDSCYGGGIVEKPYTHTDVDSPTYTSVIPNENLGTNYMFIYGDCANSPAWTSNDDFIYEYLYTEKYGEFQSVCEELLDEVKDYNIQVLIDILKKHYSLIQTMLKSEVYHFTEQAYNASINKGKAINLMIKASASANPYPSASQPIREVYRKYPIVWLLYRVFGCIQGYWEWDLPHVWRDAWSQDKNKSEESLPSIEDFFKNPNGFFTAAKRFVEKNKWTITDTAKEYLPIKKEESGEDVTIDKYIEHLRGFIFSSDVNDTEKLKRKQTFQQFVQFFYDCYVGFVKMGQQSRFLSTDSNPQLWIQDWHVDDLPRVVLKGSQEFKQCTFPKYPGCDQNKPIAENDIKELYYKMEA